VQVVTSVALFAERFEPVLADVIVVVAGVVMTRVGRLSRRGMAVWTSSAKGTVAGEEGRTNGRCGYEGVPGSFEERREREGWSRVWRCRRKD
jgi:hypothetical protein